MTGILYFVCKSAGKSSIGKSLHSKGWRESSAASIWASAAAADLAEGVEAGGSSPETTVDIANRTPRTAQRRAQWVDMTTSSREKKWETMSRDGSGRRARHPVA